jgi:hypothetical protein
MKKVELAWQENMSVDSEARKVWDKGRAGKKGKEGKNLKVMLRHAGRPGQYMAGQGRTKQSRSGQAGSGRCCYITVDSATTALQNGACTYRCIPKQMHYKTLFAH